MDGSQAWISLQELYSRLGAGAASVLSVLLREEAFAPNYSLIISAVRQRPGDTQIWLKDIPFARRKAGREFRPKAFATRFAVTAYNHPICKPAWT